MNKIELLAPAGNFEKLKIAIYYGADAVYLGDQSFSLRNYANNFSKDELIDAVSYAHENFVKVYVACNIYPRSHQKDDLISYLKFLEQIKIDAIIIADPGIFELAKKYAKNINIHISTQANTTSIMSVDFWARQGASRVNLAREISLEEIKTIVKDAKIKTECFVHGAMCISYSGRCLLSNYLVNRDANQGLCAQSCRWQYYLMEKKREKEFYPVFEDDKGTYIFNSKDLCMIEHIPQLIEAGISSLKIEGRMKGIGYLASVVRIYRAAIDQYYKNKDSYETDPAWIEELKNINNRGYSTGFFFNPKDAVCDLYKDKLNDAHIFLGNIIKKITSKKILILAKNKIIKDDEIQIVKKDTIASNKVLRILDEESKEIDYTKQNTCVVLELEKEDDDLQVNQILRKALIF